MRSTILAIAVISIAAVYSNAKIHTERVEYKHGATVLHGYLTYDDASDKQRPGVIVVHEWWGLNDYAKKRARDLAELGYIALAVDMYGEGKTTEHPNEAGEWASAVRQNQKTGSERFLAGYEALRKHKLTKPGQIAAIGYCFGGSVVLSMALGGADLNGVVSFHGSLPQEAPAGKPVKARILVCHGADDSFIPAEQIQKFQSTCREAGADWQFISYGGAKHSFTNPDADKRGVPGLAYNEKADKRSWQAMRAFFDEVLVK